jgi:hypothetical protein
LEHLPTERKKGETMNITWYSRRQASRLSATSVATVSVLATLSGCGSRDVITSESEGESTEQRMAGLGDRRRPTTPGNLRVTAKTPFSAALAWNPSSDDSGNFSYFLVSTAFNSGSVNLPKTATTFTWNTDLYPRNYYTFLIYAKDAAGNASSTASVTTTLPADTVAPSVPPVVSVAAVGSTWVSLAWTAAQDDGPYLFYQVLLNGSPYANVGKVTSTTLHLLEPATSYSFSVRAQDYGPNWSAPSNVVTATTTAPNPNDTTPPTTPAGLRGDTFGTGDGEVRLRWTRSTDDFDAQPFIRYDIYVNGVLDHTLVDSSSAVVYGNVGALNRFEVIASDTAGNASAPATLDLRID